MLKATCTCSHKKKRMRQIKKMAQRGLLDPEQEDPFSLFVASTDIRYCYYHDTHKILGNTFGMCVLQVCLTLCLCCLCPIMQSMLEQSMSSMATHADAALVQQFVTPGLPQCKEAMVHSHVMLRGADACKHIQLSALICHRTLRP